MKRKSIFNDGFCKKMMLVMLAVILSGIFILIVVLRIYSSGKPGPNLDLSGNLVPGSISEKILININGIPQGMFIQSKDTNNPVLLFIHGGPAFPEYFLFEKYKPGLEDLFTVCYWEQRGGGLSYSSKIPVGSMTFEQLTADAIEVSQYLRKRFGKEKIYLMAHSGGTPIGIQAALKEPQLYYAYMGIGQVTRQSESEKLAYQYMVNQYTASGNNKALDALHKYPVLKNDSYIPAFYKSSIRDEFMHALGIGTMRNMKSVFWGVFIPSWTCKAYTFREKINLWASKFTFIKKTKLIEELLQINIQAAITRLEIPVYFMSGKYDLTVNIDLSKAYLNTLQAPVKGFYTFEKSAHSPIFEEPERVKQILETDILKGRTTLADK